MALKSPEENKKKAEQVKTEEIEGSVIREPEDKINSASGIGKELDFGSVREIPGIGKELRAGSAYGFNAFNSVKKRLFIEAARRFYPNITRCCKEIGISWRTFANHRRDDKQFALDLAEIDREVTDRIEGVMASEAVNPKSFLDRMAYLRAHRPELYDRAKVIRVEGVKMTEGERLSRIGVTGDVVDGEIAQTFLSKRERKGLKGQRLLGGGGDDAGKK